MIFPPLTASSSSSSSTFPASLVSALQFTAAVGLSYGAMWAFVSWFSSHAEEESATHLHRCNGEEKHNCEKAAHCLYCHSKLKKLFESRGQYPPQAQLHLAVLERLLLPANSTEATAATVSAASAMGCTCRSSAAPMRKVPIPIFPVSRGCVIESLSSPASFYDTLLMKISHAQRRIVISSLYIGSGPRSKFLVDTLREKIEKCPELELVIVLDYCRMRVGPNLDAIWPIVEKISQVRQKQEQDNNNNDSGEQEQKQRQRQQSVSLFCPPSAVGLVFRRYGRVREAQGVQHTKLFVFDDNAILSGANLSDDYFLDRMDRYVLLNGAGCKALADYVTTVAKTLAALSFQLAPASSSSASSSSSSSTAAVEVFCGGKMQMSNNSYGFGPNHPAAEAKQVHAAAMCKLEQETAVPLSDWIKAIEMEAGLYDPVASSSAVAAEGPEITMPPVKTFIVPSVQFARANVFTDMAVMQTLLSFELTQSRFLQRIIASPYLNTHQSFLDCIFSYCARFQRAALLPATFAATAITAPTKLKPPLPTPNDTDSSSKNHSFPLLQAGSSASFRFVTCSPNSNAWKGSTGLAGLLPQLYYSLVRSFFFLVEDKGFSPLVDVREFEKYHLVDPSSGSYYDMPTATGSTVGAFSPYVRPDDAAFDLERAERSRREFAEQQRERLGGLMMMTMMMANGSNSKSSADFGGDGGEIKSAPPVLMRSVSSSLLTSSEEEVAALKKTHGVASATFHAKGMWILCRNTSSSSSSSSSNSNNGDASLLPFATVIGSNNLGERCVFKDVECDFVLATSDTEVQNVLCTEAEDILRHSIACNRQRFVSNSENGRLGRFQPVVDVAGSVMAPYL